MSGTTTKVISQLMQDPAFAAASLEKNWFTYLLQHRDGKKPLKIPQIDGSNASYKDAGTMTLTEALEAGDDGYAPRVGYVPRAGSALVGIDFDNCVEDRDVVEPSVADLVDSGGLYSEISPSGKGIRMLLPRNLGEDHWSKEVDDIGFFGADNKWFTVTFDSYWADPEFGDSEAVRKAVAHLKVDHKSQSSESAALRGAGKAEQPRWWLTMPYEWQERALIDALSALDPRESNERDRWIDISMSLHSTGYDWVKGIWEMWSQAIAEDVGATNYDRDANDDTWNSFTRKPNGRTLGSLFYEAREAGWDQDDLKQQYNDHINPPISLDGFTTYSQDGHRAPPAPWLIPNFLRERGSAGFVGASGVGKTTISAAWVSGMLAGDTAAVGLPQIDRPLNVAWINGEEEASDLMEHVDAARVEFGLNFTGKLICMGEEAIGATPHGLSLVVKKLNPDLRIVELGLNTPLIDYIVDAMGDNEIDVVIFDPVTEFNDGNENDRGDAKMLANAFKQIAQRTGAATVYWAHTGKMPEGKRPDWYKNDKESQRGSSQNIGALKTMGTVAPIIPDGLKSGEALQYVAQSKSGDHKDVKNLVLMKVLKIKKCPTMISCAYEIRPSKMDSDVPIAAFTDAKGAAIEAQRAVSNSEDLVTMMLTKNLIERLGEGIHNRPAVNDAMANVSGWTKDLRPNKGLGMQTLARWKDAVEMQHDDRGYVVKASVPDVKSSAFSIVIKAR